MAQQRKKPTTRSTKSNAKGSGASGGPGASRRNDKPAPPGWMWLLGGTVIGGLAFSALQFIQDGEDDPEILQPSTEQVAARSRSEREEERDEEAGPEQEERSYEFYDILMQDEVAIPEDDPPPAERRRTAHEEEDVKRAPTLEEGYSYLLQAGSFRNKDDAEHMRASLALVGLPAQIHTVELDDGQNWHRVRVGPIDKHDEIEKARKRMEDNNIEPLLLRTEG
ncbi:cell division protein [Halorhodospira halochloris]|uniref:Cell division protein n=1 Tax=Halorhodospira halochloris TaxID=1052 RepID=A0A110B4J3_HALHR|nr:SPOR domain-containing protein [Halorhodospira halochloris]MBK1650877.1 hypothetical protein [Halorhodospira halochloris]BAU56622.2 cell division protein [Halorhodospira halochloris]